MIIKDLKNVKDEEITLEDVRRAEEIIRRANGYIGKKSGCDCKHYWGWNFPRYDPPIVTWSKNAIVTTNTV